VSAPLFHRLVPLFLGNLIVAGAYWGFGVPAMRFFAEYGLFPSPIWLPAGIALVAALRGGASYLPGIFAGAVGINHVSLGAPLIEALLIATTNTLGPWIGARLTRPRPSARPPFYTLRDVVFFTLFGVGLHGLITASGGTAAIALLGTVPSAQLEGIWLTWLLSDAGGAFLLAPVLLLWLEDSESLQGSQEWWSGIVASVATLALALLFFFGLDGDPAGHLVGLPYLLFLPMLWVTVRHTPLQAHTLLFLVITLAVVGTISHHGVLYTAPSGKPLETLGLLVVSLTLTVLVVGALVDERRRMAARLLQESRNQFAAFMEHLPAVAYIKEPQGRLLFTNKQFDALLGPGHVGQTTEQYLPTGAAERLVALDQPVIDGGPVQTELTIELTEGESRTFHVAKFPVPRADGSHLIGGVAFDITDRKRIEEALQTRIVALEAASESVIITDRRGVIEYVNPAFSAISGYPAEEAIGRTPALLKSGAQPPEFYRRLWTTILSGQVWQGEIVNRRKDGSLYTEATAIAPVKTEAGHISHFVAIKHDVSERKRLEVQLAHMAHFDDLTNLPNRALFFDRLRQALAQAKRNQTRFALLFIDLDGFKAVNDAHGHETGDALLRETGRRLDACVRTSDTVARMGGDEFTVILQDVADGEDAANVADKILRALDQPFDLSGKECRIGASVGISLYPDHGTDEETLLSRADTAMYDVKHHGKNAFRFYNA